MDLSSDSKSTNYVVILYAPNVHTGGGFVLLQELLTAWPKEIPMRACLDERARNRLEIVNDADIHWVKPSVLSRFKAERILSLACKDGGIAFCFHGLPPIFKNNARVVLFQQNRLLLGFSQASSVFSRTFVRLGFERLISWLFRHRVSEYVVQTPTMARDLSYWYGLGNVVNNLIIHIYPFVGAMKYPVSANIDSPEFDFIYVADGENHKNHFRLFEAWRELAKQGFKPRLAVTLGNQYSALVDAVRHIGDGSGAQVFNLGHLPHNQILSLYGRSRALIFPSLTESFGLPLIEAREQGLPIIASELDYVRDVCEPVQTFDPYSSNSIARAVKRFLEIPEVLTELKTPTEFIKKFLVSDR
jgi:glycosyltransferase involved in cell wall biosynthesis